MLITKCVIFLAGKKGYTIFAPHNHTMETKDKLTLILHNIIEKARAGAKVEAKALASILSEENFHKRMRDKLEIFENVPEESKMFSVIYDTAKRALPDLKKNIINIHAFELVKLFYTLDENFRRNLTPIDHTDENIEDNNLQTFCEEVKEKIQREEKIVELPEGTTGTEFLLTKIADQRTFDDLNEALNNL